ncbi:MAG TPA: DUF4105 domain-containing protein [Polyangiaceae bacterium]|nr:DUF4105 domain-containing protein [Polyangiaceae bacterium]
MPEARAAAPLGSPEVKAEVERLVRAAREKHLAERSMWWRLLHYRSGLFGVSSEVDAGHFFNSPDGGSDPEAELEATLRGFFSPGPSDDGIQHPFCRFPARLAWLNAELHFDFGVLPRQPCPRLEEFRARVDPESISLIFSSYFLNNPASAFGHTLLRLNKKRSAADEERQALLDHGINFGANVDTGNAVLYALKGLAGMFAGEFTNVPYYFKVREYNDFESRDLWEFELELSPREVDMAVAHIWELGSALFAYYYLSENCSYQMLGILEVASPRVELMSKLGWPVLPVDTLRAVADNPHLIRSITYRPSTRVQFRRRLAALDAAETERVFRLGEDAEAPLPPRASAERQMAIIDTALDLVAFRHGKELLDPNSEASAHQQRLLSRRARLGLISPTLVIPVPELDNPLRGHERARLDLGEGYSTRSGFYQALDLRLALHDWTDPSAGYPETLSISFLPLRFRYYVERQRLELEQASLIAITSLVPMDVFDQSISWHAHLGSARIHDRGCDDCYAGLVEAGGGIAGGVFDDGVLGYLNFNTALAGLGPIEGGLGGLPLRLGVGPKAGLRLRPTPTLVGTLRGDLQWLPAQTPSITWAASATVRWMYRHDFALSLEGQAFPSGEYVQAASTLYF